MLDETDSQNGIESELKDAAAVTISGLPKFLLNLPRLPCRGTAATKLAVLANAVPASPKQDHVEEQKDSGSEQQVPNQIARAAPADNRRTQLANQNVVVYVDGIENRVRYAYSGFEVREEMEKFFAGNPWRAVFLANAGLRISGFIFQDDVDFVCRID